MLFRASIFKKSAANRFLELFERRISLIGRSQDVYAHAYTAAPACAGDIYTYPGSSKSEKKWRLHKSLESIVFSVFEHETIIPELEALVQPPLYSRGL